jgi:hypothetical protein
MPHKPFGSDAVATHLEQRYSPDQPRDEKGRFGEGSGDKEGGTKDDKVTVYHGTSTEAAQKILNEGLKPGSSLGYVYAAADKGTAIRYALAAATSMNEDAEVGLVTISDARGAGLDDSYSSAFVSNKGEGVPASFISRVEIYKASDLQANKEKAEPVKVLSRSAKSKEPTEVYAAVVFDENKE